MNKWKFLKHVHIIILVQPLCLIWLVFIDAYFVPNSVLPG